jgi:hypothetical protein
VDTSSETGTARQRRTHTFAKRAQVWGSPASGRAKLAPAKFPRPQSQMSTYIANSLFRIVFPEYNDAFIQRQFMQN